MFKPSSASRLLFRGLSTWASPVASRAKRWPTRLAMPLALALTIAVAAAGVQATRASAQATPGPTQGPNPQGISVLGEGVVTASPTLARVTLGVDVFNASLAAAQSEAATRMDAVVQRLKAAGIPDAAIQTVSFNVSPQYDFRDNQTPVLRGYQVQNLVEVKVSDVAGLGALLDDVVSAGATRVFGIRFESDEMGRLKEMARDQAMRNARAKAEQLAREAGVSVGRAVYIEDSDVGGVTPVRAEQLAAPAAAPAPRIPVQPGELQVRSVVRVIWSIQ